jgi:hypothetical protein
LQTAIHSCINEKKYANPATKTGLASELINYFKKCVWELTINKEPTTLKNNSQL